MRARIASGIFGRIGVGVILAAELAELAELAGLAGLAGSAGSAELAESVVSLAQPRYTDT